MGSFVWKKVFEEGEPGGGSKWDNTVLWNGKNRKGKWVASGAYIVKIYAESAKGSSQLIRKVGVIGNR